MRVSRLPCLQGIDQLDVQIVRLDLVKANAGSPIIPDLDFNETFRGISHFNQWGRHLNLNLRVRFGLVNRGTPGRYTSTMPSGETYENVSFISP